MTHYLYHAWKNHDKKYSLTPHTHMMHVRVLKHDVLEKIQTDIGCSYVNQNNLKIVLFWMNSDEESIEDT